MARDFQEATMGRVSKTAATGDRPDGPSSGLRRAADIMRTASRHTAAGLLLALEVGEAHPGDLAEGVQMTALGAATLLAKLQLAGLVDRRREAGRVYYSLTAHGRAVVDLLRRLGGDVTQPRRRQRPRAVSRFAAPRGVMKSGIRRMAASTRERGSESNGAKSNDLPDELLSQTTDLERAHPS